MRVCGGGGVMLGAGHNPVPIGLPSLLITCHSASSDPCPRQRLPVETSEDGGLSPRQDLLLMLATLSWEKHKMSFRLQKVFFFFFLQYNPDDPGLRLLREGEE